MTDNDVIRQSTYNFLSVRCNCLCLAPFPIYGDYHVDRRCLYTPHVFNSSNFVTAKTEMMGLSGGEQISMACLAVLTKYRIVTDGILLYICRPISSRFRMRTCDNNAMRCYIEKPCDARLTILALVTHKLDATCPIQLVLSYSWVLTAN